MAFEEYKPISGRYTPVISIGRGGFGISVGFERKYAEVVGNETTTGIKLYFDSSRGVGAIGFKFVPIQEDGALKIKRLNKGGFAVPARQFLIKHDIIDRQHESRYTPKEEETPHGKLFVIELKKRTPPQK